MIKSSEMNSLIVLFFKMKMFKISVMIILIKVVCFVFLILLRFCFVVILIIDIFMNIKVVVKKVCVIVLILQNVRVIVNVMLFKREQVMNLLIVKFGFFCVFMFRIIIKISLMIYRFIKFNGKLLIKVVSCKGNI